MPDSSRIILAQSADDARALSYDKGLAQARNNRAVVEIIHGNSELAIDYFQQALVIREKLGDKKGMASIYNNIGNTEESRGNYIAALDYLQRSLRLREELQDTVRVARCSYNISLVHEAMGNYPEALDYVLKYLSIFETLGDEQEIANAHNLLGNIKRELGRNDEVLDHYEKALHLREKLGEEWEMAPIYLNLGSINNAFAETRIMEENYDSILVFSAKSLEYYDKALVLSIKLKNEALESSCYNNIGLLYKNMGSYYKATNEENASSESWQKALDYLNRSLEIRERMKNRHAIMEVYNGMGDVFRRQGDMEKALDYTQRYMAIAQALDAPKFIQMGHKDLSRIYADKQDFKKAYKHRREYDRLRYDRFNEQRTKEIQRKEVLYGDQKIQQEIIQKKQELLLRDAKLHRATLLRNSLLGGAGALLALAILLFKGYSLKTQTNKELQKKNSIIEAERQRSEELLLNILPAHTAEELKQNGKARAKRYESVTVMFTDFEAFTHAAAVCDPEELVDELDRCFSAFDKITEKYGIEKIKTIGDSYMCAGGVPISNESHATDVVKAAMEMLDFIKKPGKSGQLDFNVRIGIHTGPVVAGIVGSRKFAYDIWGDTVNTAARLEQTCEPNKINISKSTYDLVKKEFICSSRGAIAVKNKGNVEMYFVEKAVK